MKNATGRMQRVAVLGGGSDIAAAIVLELVGSRGVREVLLAGRASGRRDQQAQRLEQAGADVRVIDFDALNFAGHEATVDGIFEHGDLDAVIVAFGVLGDQLATEEDRALAVDVVTTNFTAAVSVLVPTARRLQKQGHGTIVVMSSIAAMEPRRANFTYGASKAGLDAFARGLGDALVGSGASVLVVRPGFVRTRMTAGHKEAPFAVDPEEVATRVVGALDHGRDTVVHVPPIVGAVGAVLRLAPRAALRRLRR